MRDPWSAVAALLERHGNCAMVSVLTLEGSGPRETGARMVVAPDGSFHGTIGGGTLEFEAIALARKCALASDDRLVLHGFSLGPDLGQCCGGRVTLAVESFSTVRRDEVERLAEGTVADDIDTKATVGLEEKDGGFAITKIHLEMSAKIPGISESDFQEAANTAKENCPVSKVLAGAEITMDAKLIN